MFVALLILAGSTFAEDRISIGGLDGLNPHDTTRKYSVALALSGGGARGLSTVGIMKALEENGISIGAIAGTSMGGIVGGLYASGYDANELIAIIDRTNFDDLFSSQPSRQSMFLSQRQQRDRHLLTIRFDGLRPVLPRALTAAQKLTSMLTVLTARANYLAAADFDRLPIPFRTIGTDIVSGQKVIFSNGSLADAMRATIAFPLALTGLDRGNQLLMDGGMLVPIPVEIAGNICDTIQFVVAINTASPLLTKDELVSPIDIAEQVTTIMTADKLARQLARADYVIEPELNGLLTTDFKYSDSLIDLGYALGNRIAPELRTLLRDQQDSVTMKVAQVEIADNLKTLSTIKSIVETELEGHSFTRRTLTLALQKICREFGLFELDANIEPVSLPNQSGKVVNLSLAGIKPFLAGPINIRFIGNASFDDTTLSKELLPRDTIFAISRLRASLDRITRLYRRHRYDLMSIRGVDIDQATSTITVDIDEAIVREIKVTDNDRTRSWYILANLPLEEGKPYSSRAAETGLANIYGTELFERVTIDLEHGDSGSIVTVRVVEKGVRQVRLGWHFDNEYQSEQFVEIVENNVMGAGIEFLVHARYSPGRQNYYASVRADRIWATYLTANVKVYHDRLSRNLYDELGAETDLRLERKSGVSFRVGQHISRLGTLSGGLAFEEVRYDYDSNGLSEKFGLRIIHLQSLVETFDRYPFPKSGKRHLFQLQFAGKLLGGEVQYTKFFSSLEAYWAVGKYLTWHPRMSIGLSRSGLPPSEHFYIGGARSFVGYKQYELNGEKLFLMNNELLVKLPKNLYFIARWDAGEVFRRRSQIKLRQARHGAGAFIAFDSPIGPFEIGYGTTNDEISRDNWYVNVGLQF